MKTGTYIPKPVSPDDVMLLKELKLLVEEMSKNVHDVIGRGTHQARLDV